MGYNKAEAWVDIAYYRFEEGAANSTASGLNTITDSSGNRLNGTALNAPVYGLDVPSSNIQLLNVSNRLSMHFNGTNQQITISDNSKFELTQSLTLEAFIKPEADPYSAGQIIFRGDSRPGFDPYYISMLPNKTLRFQIQDNVNNTVYLNASLPSFNQWYHIAGTLDDATGQMKFFINGVLQSSVTTSIRPLRNLDSAFSPGLGIGNVEDGVYSQYFPGFIDEVRISDQALRPDQFLNATPVPEPGTIIFSSIATTILFLLRKTKRMSKHDSNYQGD